MKKDKHLDSRKRLEHIVEAIGHIESYSKGQTEKSFCTNPMLSSAILFQFTVIGEAIINVEKEKISKYDYPWHKVRSFRNLIAHEYFNIKLTAVWKTIKSDLPELKTLLSEILRNEF